MIAPTPSHCIPNIGSAARRVRLLMGVMVFLVFLALYVWLILDDASRWWRLVLFLPLLGAVLGAFQAWQKTCIYLASRGMRDLGEGQEEISEAELYLVRRHAFKILWHSLVTALLLTGIVVVIP